MSSEWSETSARARSASYRIAPYNYGQQNETEVLITYASVVLYFLQNFFDALAENRKIGNRSTAERRPNQSNPFPISHRAQDSYVAVRSASQNIGRHIAFAHLVHSQNIAIVCVPLLYFSVWCAVQIWYAIENCICQACRLSCICYVRNRTALAHFYLVFASHPFISLNRDCVCCCAARHLFRIMRSQEEIIIIAESRRMHDNVNGVRKMIMLCSCHSTHNQETLRGTSHPHKMRHLSRISFFTWLTLFILAHRDRIQCRFCIFATINPNWNEQSKWKCLRTQKNLRMHRNLTLNETFISKQII